MLLLQHNKKPTPPFFRKKIPQRAPPKRIYPRGGGRWVRKRLAVFVFTVSEPPFGRRAPQGSRCCSATPASAAYPALDQPLQRSRVPSTCTKHPTHPPGGCLPKSTLRTLHFRCVPSTSCVPCTCVPWRYCVPSTFFTYPI